MPVVPDTIDGKIKFYEDRLAQWAANATALGCTAEQISALQALTTTARAALSDQGTKKAIAQAATLTLHGGVTAMANAGADCIKNIRAKAAVMGDSVYALANIPAPAIPSPVPPPGTPTDFAVVLQPTGVLGLKWKCPNPAGSTGTIYQISRQLGGSGEFKFIGASGMRAFTDSSVPAGTTQVIYQITAVRSTAAGVTAQFVVNLGMGAGGEATAVVEPAPKLAA